MKLSFLKLFIFSVLALGAISCSNQQEEINILQTSNRKTQNSEIQWNTSASKATIYALQYTNAKINSGFAIESKSEQLPIFVSGEEALEYINIEKEPYSSEELEFIKEQLIKPESRAVLIKNVPHKDGNQVGNVVFLPFEKDLKISEKFINQFGAFFDSYEPDPCGTLHLSSAGMYSGEGCNCYYYFSCDRLEFCSECYHSEENLKDILEGLNIDPYIFTPLIMDNLMEDIPISEVPLGKSILDPNTFDF